MRRAQRLGRAPDKLAVGASLWKEEIMSRRKLLKRSVRRSPQWSSLICAARIESLETRRLLASIVVNTTLDETIANSTTSLREAVAQAQANAGDDTITFSSSV